MPDCFVIMPITTPDHLIADYGGDTDHFQHVLDHLFKPALDQSGFNLIPPNIDGSDLIPAAIVSRLVECELVLCDISSLNPNVFLELGIRTALNKPVVLVKDGLVDKIPFDTGGLGHFTYDHSLAIWSLEDEISKLSKHLQANSDNENAMWKYYGMRLQADSPPGDSAMENRLDFIMRRLDNIPDKEQIEDLSSALVAHEFDRFPPRLNRKQDLPKVLPLRLLLCPNCRAPNISNVSKCTQCGVILEEWFHNAEAETGRS